MEHYRAKAVSAAYSSRCGCDHNVFNIADVRDPVLAFLDSLVPAEGVVEKAKPVPRRLPALYRRTRAITAALFCVGVAGMYLDLRYSLTPLGTPVYIVWCLSCASMFFTNDFAVKEWKKNHGGKN